MNKPQTSPWNAASPISFFTNLLLILLVHLHLSSTLAECDVALKAKDLFIIGNAFPVCFQHYIFNKQFQKKRIETEF